MTSEIQAFIDHFPDEEALRSAIEGLLSKREELSGVRSLHGKDEHGKDVIFYAPAGLGRLRLNACVVKLQKITGSASDPTSGARNVVIQCNQALDTPVLNVLGQEEWVSQVYVMCPNELSPTAMQSIAGEFKGRASQIEFICGHDFLQLFKQCWPTFIFFQPDLLSAHLDGLGKELEADKNIDRLATAHGLSLGTARKNVYVEPTLCLERGKIRRRISLIDRSQLGEIRSYSDLMTLKNDIDNLVSSLMITDYLPPSFGQRKPAAEMGLLLWPNRFIQEWSDALRRAPVVRDQNPYLESARTSVPLPRSIIDAFTGSDEYRFLSSIYGELDKEVAEANHALVSPDSPLMVLTRPSFPKYGSLTHAATIGFPTVEFVETGSAFEWSPEEALRENRSLLVTGAPGFGKTSFCRNHFLDDLDSFKTGRSSILPLYFAASTVILKDGQRFDDVFIRGEVAERLAAEPSLKVRLYLDGLDEIPSASLRDLILTLAKEGCSPAAARYHCIATSREHVGGYSSSWLIRVKLARMSEDRIKELVTAWLDGDPGLIQRFYEELRGSEALVPLLGVPLLATLTILVFKNLHRLPENKLRLYQMFIDLLLGGWNLAKGLQRSSTFSSTIKLLLLTRLAGLLHADTTKECSGSQVGSALRQVAPNLLPDLQAIVSELVQDGLLQPTGRQSYMFPHLSFQEYLAAKDAIDPARQEEKRIVKSYLTGNDWYREVASFLVSMTTNPLKMRGWIVDLAKSLAKGSGLSDSEKRAGYLLSRLSESFPGCRPSAAITN